MRGLFEERNMQNFSVSPEYGEFNIKVISKMMSSANKTTELTSKQKTYIDGLPNPCQLVDKFAGMCSSPNLYLLVLIENIKEH